MLRGLDEVDRRNTWEDGVHAPPSLKAKPN
jgi:hypothetical protein